MVDLNPIHHFFPRLLKPSSPSPPCVLGIRAGELKFMESQHSARWASEGEDMHPQLPVLEL